MLRCSRMNELCNNANTLDLANVHPCLTDLTPNGFSFRVALKRLEGASSLKALHIPPESQLNSKYTQLPYQVTNSIK